MKLLESRRPSPAFIVSCVSLFVALSGSAVALNGMNSVRSDDIRRFAVKRSDIANNAINGAKVARNALTGSDIDEATLSIAGGGGAPSGPAGGDLTGTYPSPQIANNAVTSPKVAGNTLIAADLANDSVSASEIAASTVGASEIAAAAVRASELGPLTIASVNLVVGNGNEDFAVANCPAGTQVISGSADRTAGGTARITELGITGNGWFVSVQNLSGGPVTYAVKANCLAA